MSHTNLSISSPSLNQAFNINAEDKSAEALSALIDEATKKPPPVPRGNASSIDSNTLLGFFQEERLSDRTIRVTIVKPHRYVYGPKGLK